MTKGPDMRENTQSQFDIDDIFKDPTKFGLPTFGEFARNPEKYRMKLEGLFETADKGSTTLKPLIKEHVYEIMGYKTKSMEEVQRIMRNEGQNPNDWEIKPDLEMLTGGKMRVKVKFVKKKPKGMILDGKGSP